MLGARFPDFGWNCLLRYLTRADRMELRRVNRYAQKQVDERTRSHRELNHIIGKTKSMRHLLRTLYVPRGFCRPLPLPRHLMVSRPLYPDPSPWNVSVMTVVSYLSTMVDPRSVFHCVEVVDFSNVTCEQARDLLVSREEAQCDRQSTAQGGPSRYCIDNECGCLAAFFPGILDIHFQTFCRGNPEFAEVKAKKRGRPTARSFENQCTMRICMSRTLEGSEQKNGQQWNIVNLKIFQNGKIQMTGCKSIDQARGAVQYLLRKLMDVAPAMRYKRDCMTQLRCFSLGNGPNGDEDEDVSSQKILASIHASWECPSPGDLHLTQLMRDLIETILLRVDNESLFSCRQVCHLFREIVHGASFWSKKCERELRCQCEKNAQQQWFIVAKYNGRFQRMERVRRPEMFSHPRLLYMRYKSLRRHRPFLVVEQFERLFIAGEQVAMINSDFRTKFDLNLPRLFKIIYCRYGSKKLADVDNVMVNEFNAPQEVGHIIHAHYSPDDYVALNVKYLSPILADPVPVALESDELYDEKQTVISFFIFRTGSVIINSARNEAQLRDAYDFINGIFRKHYIEIWHPFHRTINRRK